MEILLFKCVVLHIQWYNNNNNKIDWEDDQNCHLILLYNWQTHSFCWKSICKSRIFVSLISVSASHVTHVTRISHHISYNSYNWCQFSRVSEYLWSVDIEIRLMISNIFIKFEP